MYLLRLDDASEYMDTAKWKKIERILNQYKIKPMVGVIPNNEDTSLITRYKQDPLFWNKVYRWIDKGWAIAMHGYNHVYSSNDGGINPVNQQSEFAGMSYEEQCVKIEKALTIFEKKKIDTKVFFAPSHTFDDNTLKALKDKTNIRIISDTIANKIYYQNGFYFIPQQSGQVRKLPFKVITFCYHPNTMNVSAFSRLESFIKKNCNKFTSMDQLEFDPNKQLSFYDRLLKKGYFGLKKLRKRR